MCGISGIVYRDRDKVVSLEELKAMCGTLIHRGPDDDGFFVDGNAGLGMRRLNVIDLTTGHQPISNEDQQIWIVFNGEIYNYRELRRQLQDKGHKFSTHSDTETILHAYEDDGEECVKKLNGMFAFAIWDGRYDKLFLARDRLGVKPLYYYVDDQCLVFGSELKALLAHKGIPRALDFEALDSFLTFEYIPAPSSIFRNIKKLPPGHTLVLQDNKLSVRRYWDLSYKKFDGDEHELCDALFDLLKDSVRMRLVSDVPIGAFLSGGIDSSTIVCLMSETMDRAVKTFSIGFEDDSYNELQYATKVARHFNTEHYQLTIQPDVVQSIGNLIRYLDEPLADVSILPTYLVSQLARHEVTVVLSGDGGDELFAGYDWYVADKVERYYRKLPAVLRHRWIPGVVDRIPPSPRKKGVANKIKRFVQGAGLPDSLEHFRWSVFLTDQNKNHLYSDDLRTSLLGQDSCSKWVSYLNEFEEADPLWRQQFADIKTYLADDILVKVDRMSMANSLEARTPFLDYRIVEFAAGLPAEFKLNGLRAKYLLKQCMASKIPSMIINRKKEGFSIPMKNWLRTELRPVMEDVLSPARIKRDGFFNAGYIERLKDEHLKGKANHSHQLWSLMVFGIWSDMYLA